MFEVETSDPATRRRVGFNARNFNRLGLGDVALRRPRQPTSDGNTKGLSMRNTLRIYVVLAPSLLLGACLGGDGITGPSGGMAGPPNIAGQYTYSSAATTMTCADGTSIPLPAVTDTLTITQMGNRFTGRLAMSDAVPTSGGSSFFEECIINDDSSYTCAGEYQDPNAVIVFSGGGNFSATGFSGSIDLRMTLTGGLVCSWTKVENGVKLG